MFGSVPYWRQSLAAAVAFSHGRAAVVMQDLLVNSQGGNASPFRAEAICPPRMKR
jgi:hypothetical protein